MTVTAWLERDIEPPDFVLGELLSTTSRAALIAPTGLGKTNFSLAMAFAMAEGRDFLHWRGSGKPRRVLFIDGEMSQRLMRQRLADAAQRFGAQPEMLFVFSRAEFPDTPPLNTEAGQKWIDKAIEIFGGVDFIIFDNIQALTIGDMNDPESWSPVLDWAKDLTNREIGQLWIHHTGWNETHGYGTNTREWQLDLVALMERNEQLESDIAFRLSFTKARERTPDNRTDFETVIVTLSGDEWRSESAVAAPVAPKLTPSQHGALAELDELIAEGENTETRWRDSCIEGRRVSQSPERNNRKTVFNKARRELIELNRIKFHEGKVWRKDEYFDD